MFSFSTETSAAAYLSGSDGLAAAKAIEAIEAAHRYPSLFR
jgi:hypothetical protein